ncbi:MAG: P-loop ATPase, Sll1717 family [Sulfobacillus sp.]
MAKTAQGFYAYPSQPPRFAETIEEAIKDINSRGEGNIHVDSWKDLRTTGKPIITEICREIRKSDIFLCDITGLNTNVLFELGFAVAQNKRIWITVDNAVPSHIEAAQQLGSVINNLGYSAYSNHEQIVSAFFKEHPWSDSQATPLSEFASLLGSSRDQVDTKDIFYLKSVLEHTASKKLSKFLKQLHRSILVDDASENRYQPFQRYLRNINNSRCVVIHLLSDEHSGGRLVANPKYAFLGGMTYGFGKPLLMLSQEPYQTPLDYQELLIVHATAQECVSAAESWLASVFIKGARRTATSLESQTEAKDSGLTLLEISLGEPVAEDEADTLDRYFVETGQYRRALTARIALFVGRKGTGKTANLLRIGQYFAANQRNLVITIKPVAFHLEAFVSLVEQYFQARQDSQPLTELLWAFLVYTAIADQVYQGLSSRPPYYDPTEEERTLIAYVQAHAEVVAADLGEKTEYLLGRVRLLVDAGNDARTVFHQITTQHLDPLVAAITGILRPYQELVLLFDNLDKAWDLGRDLHGQGDVLLGLLGVQRVLQRDLERAKGDTRLLIFLREDIFNYIMDNVAREPDKVLLNTHRITWEDPDLLLRVIEERFLSNDDTVARVDVWTKYFATSAGGMPIREFLSTHVLPRPRDLVYVLSNAIDESINHNHGQIMDDDLNRALGTYFEFLVQNTETELYSLTPDIRDVILSFYGMSVSMSARGFLQRLRRLSISGTVEAVTEALVSVPFVGVEVDGRTTYGYTNLGAETVLHSILADARRMIGTRRVRIHPAFEVGLRLKEAHRQ